MGDITRHIFIGLGDTDADGIAERSADLASVGVVRTGRRRGAGLIAIGSGVSLGRCDTTESQGAFDASGSRCIINAAFLHSALLCLTGRSFIDLTVAIVIEAIADLRLWDGRTDTINAPRAAITALEATTTQAFALGACGAVVTGALQRLRLTGEVVNRAVAIVVFSVTDFFFWQRCARTHAIPLAILTKLFAIRTAAALACIGGAVVTIAAGSIGTSRTSGRFIDSPVAIVVEAITKLREGHHLAFTDGTPKAIGAGLDAVFTSADLPRCGAF